MLKPFNRNIIHPRVPNILRDYKDSDIVRHLSKDKKIWFKWPNKQQKALYPTTIRQFNFSPETYKFTDTTGTYRPKPDEIKSAYGAVYDNTYEGIVPRICTKYYKQRKHSKKLKKQATKDYEYLKQIYDRRVAAA